MAAKIPRADVWDYVKSYKNYLADKLVPHTRVWKVTLDGGFTCPNLDGTKGKGGCVYCNNEGFSPAFGQAHMPMLEQYAPQAAKYRTAYKAKKFIAYFQPFTNTYGPIEKLRALYMEAISLPDVVGLCVGTRPDCIDQAVVDLLEEIADMGYYVCLEVGLQTANDQVLKRINRLHTFAEFATAMDLCQGKKFDTCVHLVLGLPGDSPEDWIRSAELLGAWNWHTVKIHPIHVVKNTRLERMWEAKVFEPLTIDEFVKGLADVLERLSPEISVQRLHGDSKSELHLAPHWTGEKQEIELALAHEFIARGTKQGSLYDGVPYEIKSVAQV
jgi:radical SAM protein (TIGR01212 family)